MQHAFISDGRLYLREPDGQVREIESHFVKEKMQRSEKQRSTNSWKSESANDDVFSAGSLWGNQSNNPAFVPFRFKNVIPADENSIYYVMTNNHVTGLFRYTFKDDEELRLFHKNEFVEHGMDYSSKNEQFVAAVQEEDGRVNLQLLDAEGKSQDTITGGDSRDAFPHFCKANPDTIVFQSAGIGRDDEGYIWAYGPEAVNRLDLSKNELTEVLSDENYDYLLPQEGPDGTLYCIRRPYRTLEQPSLLKTVINVIRFPFDLIVAIVGFLNAFISLFGKKPPTLAGPHVNPERKNKHLKVLGETIDLAKRHKAARSRDDLSLVPRSWELICLTKSGELKQVARKVSSYDIDCDGNVHYTNGFRVHSASATDSTKVFTHDIIEHLKLVHAS
jgi:hypothetical protein